MELQTSACELLWVLGVERGFLQKSSQRLNRGAVSLAPGLSCICLSAGLFIYLFCFYCLFYSCFYFLCVVLRIEHRAFNMLDKCSPTRLYFYSYPVALVSEYGVINIIL